VTRRLRAEDGQALIEFSLVLPILITILFGIISFGIAYNHYLELTDATRVGARFAATQATLTDQCAAAHTAMDSQIGAGNYSFASCASATVNGDQAVRITATRPFTISVYGLTVRTGNLSSTATERVG
jgi:Flp pilus assembly protein TadG